MQRVMVVGSPGAGKSTLSRRLAALTGLPLKHLDAEYWLPGWTEPDPADWRAKQADLVNGDRWIIDGNYGSSLAVRIARADTVVHLDYCTAVCLWRALKRIVTTFGRVRADSAEGCPEQFDPAFIAYIALFRWRKRAKIMASLDGFEGTTIRFTRPPQAERWLGGLVPRG
jgi:adenylate kinase family enzyme